jgi:hypothetical protein
MRHPRRAAARRSRPSWALGAFFWSLTAADERPFERLAVPARVTCAEVGAAVEEQRDRFGAAGPGRGMQRGGALVVGGFAASLDREPELQHQAD